MSNSFRTKTRWRVLGGYKWNLLPHEHNAYCTNGQCAAVVGVSPERLPKAEEVLTVSYRDLGKRVLSVTPAPEAPPSHPGRTMFLVIYERF